MAASIARTTRRYEEPAARRISRYDAPSTGSTSRIESPLPRRDVYRAPASTAGVAYTAPAARRTEFRA